LSPAGAVVEVRRRSWPAAVLALACSWAVLVRIPLVLNAPGHLDSDLAVDGLTLREAARGEWRWHYPGTPFIGTPPVLLSMPAALVWGVNPATLVVGGVVLYLGLMAAVWLLGRQAFGPGVAAWSMVPLAFCSDGAVWLSGRVTGGHLAAAAWHAGAFALLASMPGRPGAWKPAAALGLWCGFGLYLDSMVALTVIGLVAAGVCGWLSAGLPRRGLAAGAVFVLVMLLGALPRPVGAWVDPHDAYRGQFALTSNPDQAVAHARLLACDCLPRLLAGYSIPGLLSEPDPATLAGPGDPRRRAPTGFDPAALAAVVMAVPLAAAALAALSWNAVAGASESGRAVAVGLLVSGSANLAGFLAIGNVTNSDNYRYLVGLLVPWSVGLGLAAEAFWRRRPVAAGLVALSYALVMTWSVGGWYARLGWVDGRGLPVRKPVDDPALAWLTAQPGVTWVEGGYWDVYRLVFLSGGRVHGRPFPVYPDRFPEWRPGGPPSSRVTLIRPTPEGRTFQAQALRQGAAVVYRTPGLAVLAHP